MQITLPIYYTQNFKTKKPKSFMLGLNWYRNAYFRLSNDVKRHYHKLIASQLDSDCERFNKPFLHYKLFYKNASSDMMNVVSVVDKFLLDVLQKNGVISNDNVRIYTKAMIEVAGQDKDNPRVEVTIKECE